MSLRILIADDDAIAGRVLQARLRRAGHEAVLVADGVAALSRLREEVYAVLIADWIMPGLDGIRLVEKVREELHLPPAIVMLTPLVSETARELAAEAGANAVLAKPVDEAALTELLETLLVRPREPRETVVPR